MECEMNTERTSAERQGNYDIVRSVASLHVMMPLERDYGSVVRISGLGYNDAKLRNKFWKAKPFLHYM
jgi:hypothetical protein